MELVRTLDRTDEGVKLMEVASRPHDVHAYGGKNYTELAESLCIFVVTVNGGNDKVG